MSSRDNTTALAVIAAVKIVLLALIGTAAVLFAAAMAYTAVAPTATVDAPGGVMNFRDYPSNPAPIPGQPSAAMGCRV